MTHAIKYALLVVGLSGYAVVSRLSGSWSPEEAEAHRFLWAIPVLPFAIAALLFVNQGRVTGRWPLAVRLVTCVVLVASLYGVTFLLDFIVFNPLAF